MSKLYLTSIFFFISYSANSFSSILPLKCVLSFEELQAKAFPVIENATYHIYQKGVDGVCITNLESNDQTLSFSLSVFLIQADPEGYDLELQPDTQISLNRMTNAFFIEPNVSKKPGNLKVTKNTIINTEQELFVDIPNYNKDYYSDYHYSIECASISSNRQIIIGRVEYYYQYKYPDLDWDYFYPFFVWDVTTGKILFTADDLATRTNKSINDDDAIKIQFSPNDRYAFVSFFQADKKKDEIIIGCTGCYLLDMQTFQTIPSNRDVAFTSDERYYCTERDGVPSLVDAETHEVLYRYQTGATMTACCFSPDNRKLYIACEDLNIYEFDSQVPLSCVKDWEIYDVH